MKKHIKNIFNKISRLNIFKKANEDNFKKNILETKENETIYYNNENIKTEKIDVEDMSGDITVSDECTELLKKVISLESFDEVFKQLREIDNIKTNQVEESLKSCIKDIHDEIAKNINDNKSLKYLLYKEFIVLKEHSSAYLTGNSMMASRENTLMKFANIISEQFFSIINNALEEYFNKKIEIMYLNIEKNSNWYSGLNDSAKKMGSIINSSKKLIKKSIDTVGFNGVIDDKD